MTESTRVIGIDPGPTPGVVVLDLVKADGVTRLERAQVLQCSASLLWGVLPTLTGGDNRRLAVERFVARGRASAEQRETAEMVTYLTALHPDAVLRSAAMVKPWATDARLGATLAGPGLLKQLAGMRHARDAARHALFCAVHDAGLPDPLSKEYRR